MPTIPFRIAALSQEVDDRLFLSEALLFPEISRLAGDAARSRKKLKQQIAKTLKNAGVEELYRRRLSAPLEIGEVRITLQPPGGSIIWRKPVRLRFEYVAWRHGDDAVVAFVPDLGIEVIVNDQRSLGAQVADEARSALTRRGASSSLRCLVHFDRRRQLSVHEISLSVDVATPKQLAAEEAALEPKKSVLREVATDLTREALPAIYERDELVAQLARMLSGKPQRSVLLVGPSGVGKTALLHEVVRQRKQLQLGVSKFWSTSGARLVAGMSGFGMWQERCQQLIRETTKARAIVHLGNLVELLDVGKSISQNQGIASFLRPAIARGELPAVAECTDAQLSVVEKEDPQLLAAFEQLAVPEPEQSQREAILLAAALNPPPIMTTNRRGRKRVVKRSPAATSNPIDPEAIQTIDRLHRRYATYSAAPGRPLRFLRNLLEGRQSGETLNSSAVTKAFSHETGLPQFMLDDAVPLDLQGAKDQFNSRVIGQVEPVRLVTDLLATVKAGLTRPDRPIASLLFVGPTGVGKTEMAISLAQYLYQDESRLIRIDMSEYADGLSVDRLIGGAPSSQGLLTRKVREQPFMVVLLDEFEKAHPRLFDLLLQVLGEGRLTDAGGRVADFRNCIVILTSNLGAEGFRAAKFGFAELQMARDAREYFTQQAHEFLRPEMFNRIDRIVPFQPLEPATIADIAQRELVRVRQRDGIRFRDVSLDVEEAVIESLAAEGYHPKYGARPLKRLIERRLVAPLAQQANEYIAETPLEVKIRSDCQRINVNVRAQDVQRSELAAKQRTLSGIANLSALRRQVHRLEQSQTILRLRNEAYRLTQNLRRRRKTRPNTPDLPNELRLRTLKEILQRIDALLAEVSMAEDNELCAFYQGQKNEAAATCSMVDAVHQALNDILLEIQLFDMDRKSLLSLAIFGDHKDHVMELGVAYEMLASRRGWSVRRYHLKPYRKDLDESIPQDQRPSRRRAASGEQRPSLTLKNRKETEDGIQEKIVDVYSSETAGEWHVMPDKAIGVALQIRGEAAFAVLEPEFGVHEFTTKGTARRCLVETTGGLLVQYDPPAGITRRSAFRDQPLRRSYDLDRRTARDECLDRALEWTGSAFDDLVARAIEMHWNQRAWAAIEDQS